MLHTLCVPHRSREQLLEAMSPQRHNPCQSAGANALFAMFLWFLDGREALEHLRGAFAGRRGPLCEH